MDGENVDTLAPTCAVWRRIPIEEVSKCDLLWVLFGCSFLACRLKRHLFLLYSVVLVAIYWFSEVYSRNNGSTTSADGSFGRIGR